MKTLEIFEIYLNQEIVERTEKRMKKETEKSFDSLLLLQKHHCSLEMKKNDINSQYDIIFQEERCELIEKLMNLIK